MIIFRQFCQNIVHLSIIDHYIQFKHTFTHSNQIGSCLLIEIIIGCINLMDHNYSITQAQPIKLPLSLSNHELRLTLPQPRTCHEIPLNFSPPKPFLSVDPKKYSSEKNICPPEQKANTDQYKQKRNNNILFTIEENYYSRKNQNLLSPRPPKYKPPTTRPTLLNELDPNDRIRERKVIFTQNLIKQEKSTSSRRESLTSKPIIRNIVSNGHNQDNLSNSSRSLSVQNSFVSQFKSLPKRERTRIDNNKQKYTQIMSHFERNKEIREERNKNKFNRQIRQKIVEKEEKYIDTIFPPVYTSLFINPNKINKTLGAQIKWRRLSQLFPAQNSVILNKQGISQAKIINNQQCSENQHVAIALLAVKHSSCVLDKMFQEQTFNKYGLYFVRIFQQHNWKSIILDEYIPVRIKQNNDTAVPAFINVQKQQGQQLQLWPFLLQKAFSYYYSAYQMLRYGNTIDFLNEVMGLCPLQMPIRKRSEKQYTNLQSSLQSVDSVAIGQYLDTKKQIILWTRYSNEGADIAYSQAPNFKQELFTQQIFAKIGKVYLYSPKVYHSLSTNIIGKYSPNHHNHDRAEYSIRKLTLTQNSECLISIQQKQSRFFAKSSLDYHYMWVRVLLVQRQFNGYRWIEGKYSNSKSIILDSSLSQGQYYLLIMPQWKQTQNFELTLLVWGNHHIAIERQKGSCEEMIEQACMDLAQRKGKINQLTSTLCSYNYVCPKTGMIIENINNQKLKEDVKVHRDISGIPCSVRLLPINKDFWQEKGKMLTEIDVTIPKLSSYTVVIRMRGGIDHKLLQLFSTQKDNKQANK